MSRLSNLGHRRKNISSGARIPMGYLHPLLTRKALSHKGKQYFTGSVLQDASAS
jgi:hypothetical protein